MENIVDAEEAGDGNDEKKKKKKKNKSKGGKVAAKQQTNPPTVPIAELFPDGELKACLLIHIRFSIIDIVMTSIHIVWESLRYCCDNAQKTYVNWGARIQD